MKTTCMWASIGVVLTVLTALSAQAQITTKLTFTTTFPFYAGDANMPAGEYQVTENKNTGQLLLQTTSASHSAFLTARRTKADQARAQSEITFKKYGDIYFLNRIWMQGRRSGFKVLPSKFEQTQAKQTTGTEQQVPAK